MEGYGFMKVNVVGLQKLIQLMDNFLIINNTNRNYNYTNVLNNKESEIIKKIAIEDIDFSGQTIVLGKDGILSSTIIDSTASRLLNLGINVYVSDIDKLTIDIAKQAALENQTSSISVIRIADNINREENTKIIVGFETSQYDSLGLSIASSVKDKNIEVQKGKKTSYGIIIPTDLELQLCKCEYANRISCVTIIPGIDEDYENVADCIVEGISRYCLLTNTQKEASYYRKKSEDDISAVLINSNISPVFSTEIAISKGIKK